MKLLVISHACLTPVNQSFFADIERMAGWSISILLPSVWNTAYKSEFVVERGGGFKGAIHALPVWKPGSVPLHVYKDTLTKLLKAEQPDVIYMHHEPYGFATFQVYLANRLTLRCPIGFYAAQNIAKSYPFPIEALESAVLKSSSFAFPVTEGALSVLRSKGYTGAAEVLPLAIDQGVYYPKKDWATDQRARLGIAPSEFIVGYLGRFVEEKGIGTLMRALASIKQEPWRCVLVGTGPFEAELRAQAQDLGIAERIIFPGYVPHEEAPGWLSLFDVLMLPSETRRAWKEQFGRVITEANACGTVVIGSDSGEIPNVLRDTGGGVIFPEGNVEELAKAIVAMLHDPAERERLAKRGEESVREKYGQAHLVSRFIHLIEQAARVRSGAPARS